MNSVYHIIMWNGTNHGAGKMNHQPHQRLVFIQRTWYCICGGIGRESSIMTSFWKMKWLIPTRIDPNQINWNSLWQKVFRVSQHEMYNFLSGYRKTTFVCCCYFLSHLWLFVTHGLHAAPQASLSFTISWSLLKLVSIDLVIPSSHLILCCSLLLTPSIISSIRVFSNKLGLCIRWPNYCNFSFSISLYIEYSGLISFRINWFDLLAIQGTLKTLLQHHNMKALILWCSAFFVVQLSLPNTITGKTIALTI